MNITPLNISNIQALCISNDLKFLAAFGSVTRADFNEQSDIYFLVDFNDTDPLLYTEHYFELKLQLEKLLQRPIDLKENRAIKNQYFKQELMQTQIPIYGY
jgi:predicted nucleotidyltransferase